MAEGNSHDSRPKKRGPYKRYLKDSNEDVPKSTKHYRKKRNMPYQVDILSLFKKGFYSTLTSKWQL